MIIGWVAMWRPLEIFLYEWVPIRRRCHALEKLSKMRVVVQSKDRRASDRDFDRPARSPDPGDYGSGTPRCLRSFLTTAGCHQSLAANKDARQRMDAAHPAIRVRCREQKTEASSVGDEAVTERLRIYLQPPGKPAWSSSTNGSTAFELRETQHSLCGCSV